MCGKNRSGASVPLCIKLQGAVVCAKLQHEDSKPERREQQLDKEATSGILFNHSFKMVRIRGIQFINSYSQS